MTLSMVKILLALLLFINVGVGTVFAKVDNIENLDLLREKEIQSDKKYSFEVNESGVYVEPRVNAVGMSKNDLGQQDNYYIHSNIGVDLNKYFTGFLAYHFGNVGVDVQNKNINVGIDSSTIRVNGFGSKVRFDEDFYLKFMYLENNLDVSEQQDLSVDKEQKLFLEGVINF